MSHRLANVRAPQTSWKLRPGRVACACEDEEPGHAEASAAACTLGTPGWTAATLILAQAEASNQPADAAQRHLDVLDRVPPSRLRATARIRLGAWRAYSPPAPPSTWPIYANTCAPSRLP